MKSFDDNCFKQYILNYHGTPVVVEDYFEADCGDYFYDDDEAYGSSVFDLKNNKYVNVYEYPLDTWGDNPVEKLDEWTNEFKNEWVSMIDVPICQSNRVKRYYRKKIEEFEKLVQMPDRLDLES